MKKIILALGLVGLLATPCFADKIENAKYDTIGYIDNDGKVQNAQSDTIGYIDNNGKVQNAKYDTIGYIDNNGKVQNAKYDTIGYARDVRARWTAAFFFFFFKHGRLSPR